MKQIVFPWYQSIGGVGDSFCLTAVAKQSDLTVLVKRGEIFGEGWRIFDGLAKVKMVEDDQMPSYGEKWSFSRYGINPPSPTIHFCQNMLRIYGLDERDCLPVIRLTEDDKTWANYFISSFRRPLCFCPISGGYRRLDDLVARSKMLPKEDWQKLIDKLGKTRDILYITAPDNYVPFDGVIPILGQPIRRICSLFNVTGTYVGIESGLLHAAIAAGATIHACIPEPEKYQLSNYSYVSAMFEYAGQRNRAHYYRPGQIDGIYYSNR